jgi:hypothetical protein
MNEKQESKKEVEKIRFKVDVWGFYITFYSSVEAAIRETRELLDEISCYTYDDDQEIVIVIDADAAKIGEVLFYRYLSHECNHAAMNILNRVSVPFDYKNQEALCYTQDFIFAAILDKLSINSIET